MDFNLEKIKVIIGLGNPGGRYRTTYHNTGHVFVEELLKIGGISKEKKAKYFTYVSGVNYPGKEIVVARSTVFMNTSGIAVRAAMKLFHANLDEILIVHDDSDIALGQFKFSFGSGSAGHNGIMDIVRVLGTKKFWRLRIGIRSTLNKNKAMDFVLKKITGPDKLILKKTIMRIYGTLFPLEPHSRNTGFTLFELLIYISIFVVIITAFIGVFFNVLRIQNRQVATTEVATELQFTMQQIQQLISKSSQICSPLAGESTSTLVIGNSADCNINMQTIQLVSDQTQPLRGIIQANGQGLTSNKVSVRALNFTRYNIPNQPKGLINIEIRMSFTEGDPLLGGNPQKTFVQTLRSAARPTAQ